MQFDFSTDTITPDLTTLLSVGGTGALQLAVGTTAQRPGSAGAGAIRWNTSLGTPAIEFYNGTTWATIGSGGTVTSVAVSGGTTGLTTSGGPITTSGTITFAGTLVPANGGTGLTSIGTANQILGVDTTGTVLEYKTLTAGVGIAITPTAGVLTISSSTGGVTTFNYNSKTTTQANANPGNGYIVWNNATLTSATSLYVSATDAGGVDQTVLFNLLNTSNILYIQSAGDSTTYQRWQVTSVTNNTGWFTIGVTLLTSANFASIGNNKALYAGWGYAGTNVSSFSGGTTGLTPSSATTGAVTLAGTLAIANGGTGQTTKAAAFNALMPMTTLGDMIYANGTNTATRLAGNTSTVTQFLAQTGNGTISAAPIWTTLGAASYSVNVGPSGTVAWVADTGGYYTATVTHSLGTQNVVVSLADVSNDQLVQPDLITITSSSVVTVRVYGNTKTLRVTVLANGASIAAGASTPSSVIVQNSGVPLSGTYTALNLTGIFSATGASGTATITNAPFTGDATSSGTALTLATVNSTVGTFGSTSAIPVVTVNAKGLVTNVTTVAVVPATIRTLSYYATSLDSPNNSDWTINALAATVADPTNGGINVRQFSNTVEQGVGFTATIPTGATNIIFTFRGRSASATAGNLQMRLYNRVLASATPAAVGTWSSAATFTSVSSPANVYYQTFTQSATLASLSLTTGNLYQFEFTRNVAVAGNLAFNWLMVELAISFT